MREVNKVGAENLARIERLDARLTAQAVAAALNASTIGKRGRL